MGPGGHFVQILLPSIQVEFLYALIASILLLLIYFQTREFYELTKHKGIKYFRNSFMFLAIAHVFRFISNFFMLSELSPSPEFNTTRLLIILGYALFTFISSLGILSLVYISINKRIQKGFFSKGYSIYILAALMFVPMIIFHRPEVFLLTQIALIAFAFIMSILSYDKTKKRVKKNWMNILYGLFLVFWIIGMFAKNVRPEYIGIKIISYILALLAIGWILYKVVKKTKIKN